MLLTLQAIYATCAALHIAEATIHPPSNLPDIYPVLNVLLSTPVFAFTWLWSIKRGVEVGWALGTPKAREPKVKEPSTPTIEENGIVEGASTGFAARQQSRDFKARSVGYAESRRSSLRAALPMPSSVSAEVSRE